MEFFYNYTVGPSYQWVLYPWIEPTTGQKYFKKKSKSFQNAELACAIYWQISTWHYMVFPASDIAFTFYQVL